MINSCTKDDNNIFYTENDRSAIQLRDSGDETYSPSDSIIETILGEKAPCNPYTVQIVTQAWNNLYPDYAYNELPFSNKYVKYTPANTEEIYQLYKDTALTVWDHPLDHEVIQIGDYYIQTDKVEGDMPDLYTVVGNDYALGSKGINYQELEQLIEVPYNTFLSAESYRLCDLTHVVILPPDDPPPYYPPIDFEDCEPGCPNYPCCYHAIVDCSTPLNPITEELCNRPLPCLPDDPNWPECLLGGGSNSGGGTLTNDCGCPRYSDKRKPAGCVKVQDPTGTTSFTPVNNAKIIIKNHSSYDINGTDFFGFLWTKSTYTDDGGCWKINKECSGKIHMWIKFKNEKAYIRAPNFSVYISGTDTYTGLPEFGSDGNLLNYYRPVADYVGGISGPNFSNIKVRYNRWTEEFTQTQRYWCAAQTINAVEDMHNMCNEEDINTPPFIDIYINANNAGAAWMAHYDGIKLIELLVAESYALSELGLLPDIILDRNDPVNRYRRVAFHEMTHGSHFTNVGAGWWNILALQEYTNGGHGDGSEPFAGFVAVAESWGNHIEEYFTINPPGYSNILDNVDFENPVDPTITPWIPDGIYYDLIDNAEVNAIIIDNINGFSNNQIFGILDISTTNMEEMETRLWDEYNSISGINMTQPDITVLFDSYGF